MLSFHDLKWASASYVLCVFHSAYNGWGVFWSKLTELLVKCNRLVFCGNGSSFQWYFTGPNSFSGILRKSTSFDATEPIFPNLIQVDEAFVVESSILESTSARRASTSGCRSSPSTFWPGAQLPSASSQHRQPRPR